MPNEIGTWLGHLHKLQQIIKEIAPGFLEGDLKKFGHQRFADLLPSNILTAAQIAGCMAAIGAHCQRDKIGIPTQAVLSDPDLTVLQFINRVSNVSILPALIRVFRNAGIEADPNVATFSESAVAGMTVEEVLGAGAFNANPSKKKVHEVIVGEFAAKNYPISAADLEGRLDSATKILEIAKSIVD